MRRFLFLGLAAILALSMSACAPKADGGASTPAPEDLPVKCLTATAGAISALQDDIAATLPGVEFDGHGVVKSDSGEDFWFIALRFLEDGAPRTATWGTMQDPTANEEIAYVAIDDMAPLVSTYKQPVSFKGTTSTLIGADDCIP